MRFPFFLVALFGRFLHAKLLPALCAGHQQKTATSSEAELQYSLKMTRSIASQLRLTMPID